MRAAPVILLAILLFCGANRPVGWSWVPTFVLNRCVLFLFPDLMVDILCLSPIVSLVVYGSVGWSRLRYLVFYVRVVTLKEHENVYDRFLTRNPT